MDDVQKLIGNAPQEASPAPVSLSPENDQSAAGAPARNGNGALDASGANPREDLVMNPPVESSEMGVSPKDLDLPVVAGESSLAMPENEELPESDNGAVLSESSSTLEMRPGDPSMSSAGLAQSDQPLEKGNLDVNDHTPALSPEAKNGSIDPLATEVTINSYSSNQSADPTKVSGIDTAAPFATVKAAVSKFGGIVDWKAHRMLTVEKRKVIEQELEKAHKEMPSYKKRTEDAEEAKLKVLKELENTKRLIEELKLNLEMARKEEEQAKEDAELAQLWVAEMEQGIADEARIAAKAQVEVARARHEAAISELKSVKDELDQLKKDYPLLVAEKDASMKKTEEAISKSKEVEKSVEDLTIELITAKESLESAHAAHLEAEEHRIGAIMVKEQEILNWEKDIMQSEEEVQRVTQQLSASKDLKSKLDSATVLLQDLKAELTNYMDSKLEEGNAEEVKLQDAPKERCQGTRRDVEASLSSAKKELDQVNINIAKATEEVDLLMVAATSLKSELEKERSELAAIQQREGMASIAVSSLEAELKRTEMEIAYVQVQEKEQREKLAELPKQLQAVFQEGDQAKELEKIASDELRKAKEEAEQVKARASTMESRLHALQKEIEAAKASEKVAVVAINAIVESESARTNNGEDSPAKVTLSLEEYYELSKKVQEAEEQANVRVGAALSQIEVAKESELESLNKLEKANREMAERKEALKIALEKSEEALNGKLGIEQELRNWRAENEQRRSAGDSISTARNSNVSPKVSVVERLESTSLVNNTPTSSAVQLKSISSSYTSSTETQGLSEAKVTKKKKKFLFPRFFMFLGKKKARRPNDEP